jgi:hypothetical protein
MTSLQEDNPYRGWFAGIRQISEPRRDDVLRYLLTMENLFDLTLRGSDGTLVRANRCILASRSSVFLGLLYGSFMEASNSVVDVGYEGKVIQAIVNYIYTDQVPACPTKSNFGDEDDASENAGNLEFMRFLVALIDASEYFALSELRRMTESSVDEMMLKNDKLAIHCMAVCAPDCDLTKVLRDTALGLVKRTPNILIHGAKSVVALMYPSYLEEILEQERLPMTEYTCFQILQAWATAEEEDPDGDSKVSIMASTEVTNNYWQNNRKRVALEMSSHVHVENICPTDLSIVVASSGLVSAERLGAAYKTQDLRSENAEKGLCPYYKQFRGGNIWMRSGANIVVASLKERHIDVVDCPLMKSGVHKWRMQFVEGKIEKKDHHGLGVIASCPYDRPLLQSNHLSAFVERKGGWALFEGFALHRECKDSVNNQSRPLPFKFRIGSIVSFSLDLDRGGILTVSIDGDAPFEAFSGMCRSVGANEGFLPYVSIQNGSVKFLGFEQDD